METLLPLLIIGAGPYGLALSAYARRKNIKHRVIGRPMDLWKSNMPQGMFLRSQCDWHYDSFNEHTIERYLDTQHLKPADVEPLSLEFYLGYADWFVRQTGIEIQPAWVQHLNYVQRDAAPHFEAVLQDGEIVAASNVVLALGFRYFKQVPASYVNLFPAQRVQHTLDLVDLSTLKGKRVLIIGGRQSAFEWAALSHEQGARAVYMTYRHPTPAFQPADWSWVNPVVDEIATNPRWFRDKSAAEKEQVTRRLWAEGRLKLEPWLAKRIAKDTITLFPESQVTACVERANGELDVTISDSTVTVDQIVLATGYKVNIDNVPLLASGNLLPQLNTHNGFPVLDEHFQSNIPGLFFTSMCATQDFGPFFAFTAAVRTSAKLIGAALEMSR